MPESTRRAYRGDVKRFSAWCAETGRPGLPTDGTTLTEYATHIANDLGWAPVSIERARWAILKWHSLAEVPPPSTDGLVGVLKGYRARLAKAKSPKARPRKATPANRSALVAMLGTLDRSTLAGKRNAAIILLGFAVAARRGEIAGLDIGDLTFEERGLQVSVYRQKTRRLDDPVVQYRPDKTACPVEAVQEWTEALAAHGRAGGPLFVRISRHGQLANPLTRHGVPIGDSGGRMTGQAVAEVIRRCAITAGLSGRWSGHSLRRGLATSMHAAGAERRAIERQGGWEAGSRAVSGYIEDADRWLHDVLDGVL
jgi:site-specific recombinase XerD